MKLHASRIIRFPGYTRTTTLCGRMNAASNDGMNIADDRKKLTCKFCMKLIDAARNPTKEG